MKEKGWWCILDDGQRHLYPLILIIIHSVCVCVREGGRLLIGSCVEQGHELHSTTTATLTQTQTPA